MLQKAFAGKHTETKLAIVEKYCKAYNTALSHQPFTRVYIDAFAGTGKIPIKGKGEDSVKNEYLLGDELSEIEGSASRALGIEPEFHKFVFIESVKAKCEKLSQFILEHHANKIKHVTVIPGDANEEILKLCETVNWISHRAVLFLDPFGMEVQFKTIIEVSKTKAIDMWVLFPIAGVNRLMQNDANQPEKWEECLTRTLGNESWKETFYKECEPDPTLFSDNNRPILRKHANWNTYAENYLKSLKNHFASVAENPYLLSNSYGSPLYLLCFAASNKKGAVIAKRIAESVLRK